MITVKTAPLVQAVQSDKDPKRRIAALAQTAVETMDKVLEGDESVNLQSIGRLADHYGFDVEVTFKKRVAEPVAA